MCFALPHGSCVDPSAVEDVDVVDTPDPMPPMQGLWKVCGSTYADATTNCWDNPKCPTGDVSPFVFVFAQPNLFSCNLRVLNIPSRIHKLINYYRAAHLVRCVTLSQRDLVPHLRSPQIQRQNQPRRPPQIQRQHQFRRQCLLCLVSVERIIIKRPWTFARTQNVPLEM